MSYEKNLEYARAAIAEARTYMSFGHDNYEPRPSFREGCVDRSRDAVRAIIDRRAAADRSYLSGERRERLRVRESARRAMRSGCGNCYEQASLAYTYLEKQGIRPIDLFQLKALDHVFVVIGRTGDTPAKVSSWGAGAVVCDPWAPEGRRVFRALPMEQNFCRTLATRPETAPYHPPSGHASGDAHFEVELLISDLAKKAGVIAAPQPPPRSIQERATRP